MATLPKVMGDGPDHWHMREPSGFNYFPFQGDRPRKPAKYGAAYVGARGGSEV